MLDNEEKERINIKNKVLCNWEILLFKILIEGKENSNIPFIKLVFIHIVNIEKKVIIPRILKIVNRELIKISFKSSIGLNILKELMISLFIYLKDK